jgi:hypothetical protein
MRDGKDKVISELGQGISVAARIMLDKMRPELLGE